MPRHRLGFLSQSCCPRSWARAAVAQPPNPAPVGPSNPAQPPQPQPIYIVPAPQPAAPPVGLGIGAALPRVELAPCCVASSALPTSGSCWTHA